MRNDDAGTGAGKRPRYSKEFKADVLGLVLDEERTVADVARPIGIVDQTLGNRVRQARTDRGKRAGLTTDEKRELGVLHRENRQLNMERELLKRAAVFFAKEPT